MTTKEFIKRVQGLGFAVMIGEYYVRVEINEPETIGFISRYAIHELDSLNSQPISAELFDLMVEYAKTPVDEREEPKKYYLRAEGYIDTQINYLNMAGGGAFFNNSNQVSSYQTQFTEAEIAKLPKWCQALEWVEV